MVINGIRASDDQTCVECDVRIEARDGGSERKAPGHSDRPSAAIVVDFQHIDGISRAETDARFARSPAMPGPHTPCIRPPPRTRQLAWRKGGGGSTRDST